jgi:hypothetical protein
LEKTLIAVTGFQTIEFRDVTRTPGRRNPTPKWWNQSIIDVLLDMIEAKMISAYSSKCHIRLSFLAQSRSVAPALGVSNGGDREVLGSSMNDHIKSDIVKIVMSVYIPYHL